MKRHNKGNFASGVFLALLITALFLGLSVAQVFAGESMVEVYDLDDLDGFAVSVAGVMSPAVVQAMTTQGVPEDIIVTAKAIADDSFSAGELQSRIREALMMGLTDEHVGNILAWRKTALGNLLNEAENQHNSATYYDDLRAYSTSSELYSVSDARRLMVTELYSSMSAIEQSVEMIVNANYAMALATAITNGEDTPDEKTMRKVYEGIAESRDQIMIGVRGRMLVTGLYVYRTISDEDLASYMDFNMTEAGARYNQILFSTVDRWLFDSTKRFGFRFGQALRKINAQQPA
ncbi:MAG: hypothetical protein COC09_01110 [Gammaproteobacteria bacterium]|nr:MAG: hypothetical protein COC09_01110 [Gammaproteobacteria bacterium]